MTRAASKHLLTALKKTISQLTAEFDQITEERRETLMQLVRFIRSRIALQQTVLLNFICTHNSRRSHIAQVWAQAAACYYDVANIKTYSGGTEATAFNP